MLSSNIYMKSYVSLIKENVDGSNCNNNRIISLEDAPTSCKSLNITNNPIELTDQMINTFKYKIFIGNINR